jgi:hypothetical protein
MYNAFQSLQALEAGQGQRKAREDDAAKKSIGNAFAAGDLEGASRQAFQYDPAYGMQVSQYVDQRNAMQTRKDIGAKLGAKDYAGGMADAFSEGELDLGAQIQSMMAQMNQQERADYAFQIGETASVAGTLLSFATPEERKAALMNDPTLQRRLEMAGVPLEQAINGPMDNASLEGQMRMGLTAGQLLEDKRWQAGFDREGEYRAEDVKHRNRVQTFAESDAASNGGAGSYGLNVVWGKDENGNPVAMQPSKGGGLRAAETPDGVSLLDPYSTAFDRKLGTLAAGAEGDKNPALLGVEAAEADMARLSEQIDLAITQTDKNNTGFWGQYNVTATDLNATLKTIRASGAFTSLVNLKEQGGTLGALSDTELQLLEAKIANVERSQSQEQLDRNLLELKNALQGSTTRIRAAYEKEYAAGRYGRGGATPAPAAGGRVGPSGQPVPEGFE